MKIQDMIFIVPASGRCVEFLVCPIDFFLIAVTSMDPWDWYISLYLS